MGIGIRNGITQRTHAGIVRVRDGCRCRENRVVLKDINLVGCIVRYGHIHPAVAVIVRGSNCPAAVGQTKRGTGCEGPGAVICDTLYGCGAIVCDHDVDIAIAVHIAKC